jgi:hypothetical protein
MMRPAALILALLGLAAARAPAQQATPEPQDAASEPAPELKALADTCMAHKFETLVISESRRGGSRVRICGKQGQTDADWLKTLRDSIRQTEANDALSQPVKDQIVAALKVEISRLETAAAAPPATAAITGMSSEIVAPREPAPQYSVVPPLPAPLPRAGTPAAAARVAASAPLIRPRLTIRCALPRESFAACDGLKRETLLLIRADEDLAAGISLRFLRGGDARAELDLGSLRKGESLREKLPSRVCAGVMRGKVQVQILSKSQVAETLGPYPLHCGS